MKIYRLILALSLLVLPFISKAQFIRLNNLQFQTQPNLHEFDVLKPLLVQESVDGNFYALLQFEKLPPALIRKQISAATGIAFLGYLPENTYYVRIPVTIDAAPLFNYGIRGIYRILPEYKLSPQITGADLPAHALNADHTIRLNVVYYKGLDQHSIAEKFSAHDIVAVPKSPHVNVVSITIPVTSINKVAVLPFVQYVEPVGPRGEPENYESRTDHRNNFIQNDYASGLHYNGEGVWIGMNDDGWIGTHIDYQGRIDQSFVPGENNPINTHGDHVSGIIMGAGNLDPRLKGNASGSILKVYTAYTDLGVPVYEGFYDVPDSYTNPGVKINSTSYSDGCNVGYTTLTQTIDETILDYPEFMHIFSAGNYGGLDCGPINGWYEITGGHKVGKNCITVGNVSKDDELASGSSRGPAKDGRLKPEICAVGTDVNSTQPNNNYEMLGGTSMACPAVAGTFANLIHVYKDLNGGAYPPSSLIKASLMNTADDLGNAGPDYKYGYGRINARRAYLTLKDHNYLVDSLDQDDEKNLLLELPAGVKQLRVMLYWNDFTASLGVAKDLVNDLKLEVIGPSGIAYDPWVLNPFPQKDTLNKPARRGTDTLNNHEQVTLDDPPSGTYQLSISSVEIPEGPQSFVIVYEYLFDELTLTYPTGGESWNPGEKEKIRWDSYGGTGSFTLEISPDEGQTWTTIASTIDESKRFYDYTIPIAASVSGKYKMRISRGSIADESDAPFSILAVPGNLTIVSACPDTIKLSWNAVTDATSYEIYKLGIQYMEPVATTAATFISISGLNPNNEDWLSVQALGVNDAVSRRAIAIKKNPGLINCILTTDAATTQLAPGSLTLTSCMELNALPVSTRIKNEGLDPISGFLMNMKIGANPVVTEIFPGTILPGDSIDYHFAATANLAGAGIHLLQCWSELPGDQNSFNDTLSSYIEVISAAAVSLPFYENFETFELCETSNDCEVGVCLLTNGFTNIANLAGDDIDWRTNSGPTPGYGTGPDADFEPATPGGKYLYLEAGGCKYREAQLITPCVDLSQAILPKLTFAYHLFGMSMGDLHVDVFANGGWVNDIVPPISGNHGYSWKTDTIDLSGYVGGMVTIRFRGITGSASGSDMALDAIGVFESSQAVQAAFNFSGVTCADSIITFTDFSLGNVTGYNWNFGTGANPATANTQGPHEVIYATPGAKSVLLTVTGTALPGSDAAIIEVTDHPYANFFIDEQHNDTHFISLTNTSSGATSYLWHFGDGTSSTEVNPDHIYAECCEFFVTLVASGPCGIDTSYLTAIFEGIETQFAGNEVFIFPNPSNGWFNVQIKSSVPGKIEMGVYDVEGRKLLDIPEETYIQNEVVKIDLSSFSSGIYFLRMKKDDLYLNYKLIR